MFKNHFLDVLAQHTEFRWEGVYSFEHVKAGLLVEADREADFKHPIKGDHVTEALYHMTDAQYEALAHHITNRNAEQLGLLFLRTLDDYAVTLAENDHPELAQILWEMHASNAMKERAERDLEGDYFKRGA